jgi:uncharacterized RDD family membrane protein YckC
MEHHSDSEQADAAPEIAPQETHEEEPPTPQFVAPESRSLTETHDPAGFWLRFVAFSIDMIILTLFAFILLLVGLCISIAGIEYEFSDLLLDADDGFPLGPLWISGVLTASAAYFTILHSEYGQTIGKSLLHLEVRTPNGAFLGYGPALFRWLAYSVSWFFGGLGFLWIAATPSKRGWHDLLAHTVVVTPKS